MRGGGGNVLSQLASHEQLVYPLNDGPCMATLCMLMWSPVVVIIIYTAPVHVGKATRFPSAPRWATCHHVAPATNCVKLY